MLDIAQSKWIYKKVNILYNKYIILYPFKQEDWDSIRQDCIDLVHDSKNNKDVECILLSLIEMFDKLHSHTTN